MDLVDIQVEVKTTSASHPAFIEALRQLSEVKTAFRTLVWHGPKQGDEMFDRLMPALLGNDNPFAYRALRTMPFRRDELARYLVMRRPELIAFEKPSAINVLLFSPPGSIAGPLVVRAPQRDLHYPRQAVRTEEEVRVGSATEYLESLLLQEHSDPTRDSEAGKALGHDTVDSWPEDLRPTRPFSPQARSLEIGTALVRSFGRQGFGRPLLSELCDKDEALLDLLGEVVGQRPWLSDSFEQHAPEAFEWLTTSKAFALDVRESGSSSASTVGWGGIDMLAVRRESQQYRQLLASAWARPYVHTSAPEFGL